MRMIKIAQSLANTKENYKSYKKKVEKRQDFIGLKTKKECSMLGGKKQVLLVF